MNKLKKSTESIDIYFNDIEPEFVVRVHDVLDGSKTTHFRNIKIRKTIKETCAYLTSEAEK